MRAQKAAGAPSLENQRGWSTKTSISVFRSTRVILAHLSVVHREYLYDEGTTRRQSLLVSAITVMLYPLLKVHSCICGGYSFQPMSASRRMAHHDGGRQSFTTENVREIDYCPRNLLWHCVQSQLDREIFIYNPYYGTLRSNLTTASMLAQGRKHTVRLCRVELGFHVDS